LLPPGCSLVFPSQSLNHSMRLVHLHDFRNYILYMFCFGPLKTHTLHTLAKSNSLPLKIGLWPPPQKEGRLHLPPLHFQGANWLFISTKVSCWWFKNPENQLRSVGYPGIPNIFKVLYIYIYIHPKVFGLGIFGCHQPVSIPGVDQVDLPSNKVEDRMLQHGTGIGIGLSHNGRLDSSRPFSFLETPSPGCLCNEMKSYHYIYRYSNHVTYNL